MLQAREGQPLVAVLAPVDHEYLRKRLGELLSVEGLGDGRCRIRVRRVAGVWPLPSGETLCVHPHKGGGVELLSWMAAVDPHLRDLDWRGLAREGGGAGDVASALVRIFCALLAQRLATSGPARDYVVESADLGYVRGSVRWSEYARRSVQMRLPCRYWERRPDTPLNRLLAATLDHVAATPLLAEAGQPLLASLRQTFAGIPRHYPPHVADVDRPLGRLDAAFAPVRALAIMLLNGGGLGMGGRSTTFAFDVNLERLFERSIEAALLSRSWVRPPRFQAPPPYLLDGVAGRSRMDALLYPGTEPVVLDAKYTRGFSPSHLYQVLAYMRMLEVSQGVLVYPEGADVPGRWLTSADGAERPWRVRLMTLDPVEVGAQRAAALRAWADELAGSLASAPGGGGAGLVAVLSA